MYFQSINPYTETVMASYDFIDEATLHKKLDEAVLAQQIWKNTPVAERADFFLTLADLIGNKHEELAHLATIEMGKTLSEAKLEVLKCARGCEFYGRQAEHLLQPKLSKAETGKTVQVSYEPLGVILGIFPWNFPYWQILRSAIPTVIAGNAMLIKPAPNVPQCSLAIQKLIEECGLPHGLIQVVFANEGQIANMLADDRIKAATLTGSDKAGSAVASIAGKHIKKTVLELGGSDPFIVLEDANLNAALSQAITARFQNNGQSCIAAKRFIVHASIAEEFVKALSAKVNALHCGNPLDAETQIGPLARKDLMEKLDQQVEQSLKQGAQLLFRQESYPKHGFFYPPAIIGNIPPKSPAYQEELFGPVISLFTVNSDEEAITLANDTAYGLGASVWSNNTERAIQIANQLDCGQVFINELVKSQPTHPFGGIKKSGYGRELGEYGLYEFCNVKALWI